MCIGSASIAYIAHGTTCHAVYGGRLASPITQSGLSASADGSDGDGRTGSDGDGNPVRVSDAVSCKWPVVLVSHSYRSLTL